jgi:hypothetical protein
MRWERFWKAQKRAFLLLPPTNKRKVKVKEKFGTN